MRRALLVVLLLSPAACRRKHAVPTETPTPAPAPAPAPVAEAAPDLSAATAPSSLWPEEKPSRKEPPSEAELKAALKPTYGKLGGCIAHAYPPGERKTFELRLRVEPSGEVSEAGIGALPDADACVKDLFSTVRLPAWAGAAIHVGVTLQRSGEPLPIFTTDGGA